MIKIYHNPRCSTSRKGCDILSEINEPYEIINYLTNPLSIAEIKDLIKKLGIKPIDLVRTKEEIWKEEFQRKKLTDDQIINAMHLYPKLIQRPVIVKGNKAIIGRPPELIKEFLEN